MSFNENGYVRVQLPAGPQDDSYKIYLFVRIIDDLGGVTEYKLGSPIVVEPDFVFVTSYLNDMLDNKNTKTFIKQLFTGNLQQTTQNIISYASNLNQINTSNLNNKYDKVILKFYLKNIIIKSKLNFFYLKGKF